MNMNCKYCFYRDVADNRDVRSFGIMSEGTMRSVVKAAFSYADKLVSFTFQGGEPTLAGEAYFRAFHRAVEKYNTKKIQVRFSLQTNGYDISDGLLDVFSEHKYLLGVSLDGDRALHDSLRTSNASPSTYDRICKTLDRLDEKKVDYNILTVISEDVAARGAEVYKHLRDRGFRFLQFIPYGPDFGCEGEALSYTLTNESYAHFLNETFREYRADFIGDRYVSVRQFDNFVRIAAGLSAECCGMGGRCYSNIVVEADGGVYPCDFYVLDKWRMGNIKYDTVESLLGSEAAVRFVKESFSVPEECRACPYFAICKGGCRRHRETGGESLPQNRYCAAYRSFFEKSGSLIVDMARRLCTK